MIETEQLIEKVKNSVPYLGAHVDFPELFGRYGYVTAGMCEKWIWNDKALEQATREELLMMLAISFEYWLDLYESLSKKNEEKAQKLDEFVGTCEEEFFGYDDSYTLEIVDRVLEQALETLRGVKKC